MSIHKAEKTQRGHSISPQQTLKGLRSPEVSPQTPSARAASFDIFDQLAARHAGLMDGASLKAALAVLVKGTSKKAGHGLQR